MIKIHKKMIPIRAKVPINFDTKKHRVLKFINVYKEIFLVNKDGWFTSKGVAGCRFSEAALLCDSDLEVIEFEEKK